MSGIFLLVLLPPAILLALPTICNAAAWLGGLGRAKGVREAMPARTDPPSLLFLIPAHDEEGLIGRCLDSLRRQDYPRHRITAIVVADHCSDRTAPIAREAGAVVLERRVGGRGKHHAIGWALDRLPLGSHAAVVLIDADTILEPDFARQMARHAPLEGALIQSYDGISNEFENRLTRMAGVLTRNRWDTVLHWKEAAGLNCPLTGDGSLLGTDIIARFGWSVRTITEGWELYARFTLAGVPIRYEPRARLYAQEARSAGQSGSQRRRWTSGRLAVLRHYAAAILTARGVPLAQRLDLVAELSAVGPVMRAFLGVAGLIATVVLDAAAAPVLVALFATSFLDPLALSLLSLSRHPQPRATMAAFLGLPAYAAWRVGIGFRAFFESGKDAWIRTARHDEAPSSTGSTAP